MDHKFTYSEGSWYGTYCMHDIIIQKFKMATNSTPKESRNDRDKVNSIEISNSLRHFPKGLGGFFPRLKILNITNCKLESVSRKDLAGLECLESLDLAENFLKSLPDDLFNDMCKLKRISFKNNLLGSFSSQLLSPVMKNGLELVDFRDNRDIDDWFIKGDATLGNLPAFVKKINENVELLRNRATRVESFQNDLIARLTESRSSGKLTDFTIVVDGPKKLKVHKTILAVQSPVFAAMFESGMSEQTTGKITIDDFSAEAVEQFIDCLYTGEITNVDNAVELFGLAAKYDVPKFKAACKQIVMMNIDKTNAFEVLALGHLHSDLEMQRIARDVIKQTMPDFEIDESVMRDPQRLDKLLKAVDKRNKKMQETEIAENEIAALCKKSKKSS